ncbi:hypothetical protein ACIO3S_18000 [Nocardioides sp. NPDC087217]|uniref:hypothetical protein n=1 Tax=Nocardioides sp. NPDC087217 TaxID=3364335 RepID=UPI003825AA57
MDDIPIDPLQLPELLAVQVEKGVLAIVYTTSQNIFPLGRVRMESDIVEYPAITPDDYDRATGRLGLRTVALMAVPVYAYMKWGVLAAIGILVVASLVWRSLVLEAWFYAEQQRKTPHVSHRLRIWFEGESFDLLFTELEELEKVEDDILQGMQDVAFSSRIDVSGNGNAINIGVGNTAQVDRRPED